MFEFGKSISLKAETRVILDADASFLLAAACRERSFRRASHGNSPAPFDAAILRVINSFKEHSLNADDNSLTAFPEVLRDYAEEDKLLDGPVFPGEILPLDLFPATMLSDLARDEAESFEACLEIYRSGLYVTIDDVLQVEDMYRQGGQNPKN